jgi:hypothetical protein
VQNPGLEVADFLAVRPEHRGDDDGVDGTEPVLSGNQQ